MLTKDSATGAGFDGSDAPTGRADTFDVRQLWSTLRQHSGFVIATGVVVFAAVMAVTLLSPMSFRAVSRLYLGELEEGANRAPRSKDEIDLSNGSQGVVGSEVEIIQSRSLVAKAILDSGLNVVITATDKPSPRFGQWLLSRRDATRVDVAGQELRVRDARLSGESAREQSYTLRFVSEREFEAQREDGRVGLGQLGEMIELPGASFRLLAGEQRKPVRGSEYVVTVRPLMVVVDEALRALQVSAPRPSPQAPPVNVLTLEFSSGSPRMAASFLERLVAAYLAERQAWKVEDATAAEAFVGKQLETMRASLDDVQKKLAEYRANNRVVVMDNEAKALIEQIGKYEEQRVAARLEVAALGEIKRTLKDPNAPVGAFLLGEAQDSVLEGMATSLSTARQKLTDLETRFNESAPDVRDQREQVAAQLDTVKNYVSSRAARAQESLGTLNSIIGQFEARLKTVPGAELGMAQLVRETDVYERTYSYLLERQQQMAIVKAAKLSKNRVLDAPQAPYREDSPKLLLRLASAPLGLLLGAVMVLLTRVLSSKLQSEADARTFCAGAPIFARVPLRLRRKGERRGLAGPGSLDVLGSDTTSSFTEAFRTLRTHLKRSLPANGQGRVILITSPSAGDGKTTCALALAASLAADGKRVVVVDADLRQPNHPGPPTIGDDWQSLGLRDVLAGDCGWGEALQPVRVDAGMFYSVPAGGKAAPELLGSERMGELLKDARLRCDYVLLDAPSFPDSSDALLLAGSADLVLSVFRLDNTARKAAHEHVRGLSVAARSFAVLLNQVGVSAKGGAADVPDRALRPAHVAAGKMSTTAAPAPSSPQAS
jgi:uncharacterized protein involved in exopolysaccharide biosynthesis/Mrp family chromosome partitioning ATPase